MRTRLVRDGGNLLLSLRRDAACEPSSLDAKSVNMKYVNRILSKVICFPEWSLTGRLCVKPDVMIMASS